jgi:hypothetical protein
MDIPAVSLTSFRGRGSTALRRLPRRHRAPVGQMRNGKEEKTRICARWLSAFPIVALNPLSDTKGTDTMLHKFFPPATPEPSRAPARRLPGDVIPHAGRLIPGDFGGKLPAQLGRFLPRFLLSDNKFLAWCALTLRSSYAADATFATRALADVGQFQVTFRPNDETFTPGYIVGKGADGNFLIISGTASQAAAMKIVVESTTYLEEPGPWTVNKAFHDAAFFIQAAVFPSLDLHLPIYLVGHSYGGAVAAALAAGLAAAGGNCQLVTFGAPKPGFQDMQDFLAATLAKSIVGADDPVPSLPPAIWETVVALLFPPAFPSNWSKTRPALAHSLFVSDTAAPQSLQSPDSPGSALIDITLALLSGTAIDGIFGPGHSMRVYYSRLRQTFATYDGGVQLTWPGRRDLDALADDLSAAGL